MSRQPAEPSILTSVTTTYAKGLTKTNWNYNTWKVPKTLLTFLRSHYRGLSFLSLGDNFYSLCRINYLCTFDAKLTKRPSTGLRIYTKQRNFAISVVLLASQQVRRGQDSVSLVLICFRLKTRTTMSRSDPRF